MAEVNWLALRNWKEAERVAAAALAQNPDDQHATADLVEAYRRQDRFDEALKVCVAAIDRRPSPRLFLSRALVLSDLERNEEAAASVKSALDLADTQADDADSVFTASRAFSLL